MISIIHLGNGGRYTNYLKETIKVIARLRPIQLLSSLPVGAANRTYRIAIDASGTALDSKTLTKLLTTKSAMQFVIGDSRGLQHDVIDGCDVVYSISSLPVSHQIEAAILAEQIEHITVYGE